MEFRILGPLEVRRAAELVQLGGPRQRSLLGLLLLHANEVVSRDRLIEELWDGQSPATAASALRVHVTRLRRAFGPGGEQILVTRAPGYQLRVGSDELDLHRFQRLAHEAGEDAAVGRWDLVSQKLHDALGLWRGPPLAELTDASFAQSEIARIDELRLVALERRIEADLALGRHDELVGELEILVEKHPFRERLRLELMLALYRSGRQADALAVYQATRRLLVEDLGIEPGAPLRELEAAILRQDTELELQAPAATVPAEETEALPPEGSQSGVLPRARKTVTVLVSDVAELTRDRGLDPELRGRLGDRSFGEVARVLGRHGAMVERFLDDRIMGLFGVPTTHEDDALRALRAAVELRENLAAHGEAARTGIDTGEVLTGDPAAGERLVTGNAIGGAASLQQASAAGEIVISEATRRLVPDAVTVEPRAIRIPNSGEDMAVWRLLELEQGAPPFERLVDAPLVGRGDDLSQLRQAFGRATREQRACLVTVFGDAGIGKTRLAQELARSLEGEATVLVGRCLSYGEGITYWPVREIVEQATGGRDVSELLQGDPDLEVIAERLESAMGSGTSGAVKEEVFWAVRRLVEALARELPLLLVFEDVHWGEPTLLDLIEYLIDWVRDVPVLVICLARPELLDGRAAWGGGKLNATSILLEPLTGEESAELIGMLPAGPDLAPETRARIVDAAGGNPLFVEQMLALLAEREGGVGEVAVPPAIQALLAARLDRLRPDERRLLERGSVEGETFHADAVAELTPSEAPQGVRSGLMSLVRKELIRAERWSLPGQEAFRFRHALIRDAAYEGLSKETRSDLHERCAAWLENATGERADEFEELLGYHLERAYRYRAELGANDGKALALADQARLRLSSAGRLAFRRGDARAAINLLERARLLPALDEGAWLELAPDLGFAFFQAGELARAEAVLSEATEHAAAIGDHQTEKHAWLVREQLLLYNQPDRVDLATTLRVAKELLAVFQEAGDDLALTRAWNLLWEIYQCTGQAPARQEAAERALDHARRAGSRLDETWSLSHLGYSLTDGPTSVSEGVRICEELLNGLQTDPLVEAMVSAFLASLVAMQGRLDYARELIVCSRAGMQEFGLGTLRIVVEGLTARVEVLADDLDAAERALRAAVAYSSEIGDNWFYVACSVELARVVCDAGRPVECLCILEESERHRSPPDWEIVVRRPYTRALALARVGRLEDAETAAREAVSHADATQFIDYHADALLVLGEVLRLAAKVGEAASALEGAARLFDQKGNIVSAARARIALGDLAQSRQLEICPPQE